MLFLYTWFRFADSHIYFCYRLGLSVTTASIWERINALADDNADNTDLVVTPTLFGERHNPTMRASVTNITAHNTSLGSVYTSLSRGIITNLHSMMSHDFLLAGGVERIVGSGTAVVKNAVIRREIERQFSLPLVLSDGKEADAAVGAALAVMSCE